MARLGTVVFDLISWSMGVIQFPEEPLEARKGDFTALVLAPQQQQAAARYSADSGVQRKDFCWSPHQSQAEDPLLSLPPSSISLLESDKAI